jgi:peptide chain release factor 3
MSFLKKYIEEEPLVISHPDAGKTTLTETTPFWWSHSESRCCKKIKIKKGATSDFMEIERQRGISVSTSVLHLITEKINILDTPATRFCRRHL